MSSPSIHQRIQFLVNHVYPRGGRPATASEISRSLAKDGYNLSHSAIHKILTGETTHPHQKSLDALAHFFRVPARIFNDDDTAAAEWDKVQAWLTEYRRRLDTGSLAAARSRHRLFERRYLH